MLSQEQCMKIAMAAEVQAIRSKDPAQKEGLKALAEQATEAARFKQMMANVRRNREAK